MKRRRPKPSLTPVASVVMTPLAPVSAVKKPTLSLTTFFLGIFIFLLSIFVFLIGAVTVIVARYVNDFTQAAEVSFSELKQTVQTGLAMVPQQTAGRKNILLLGVDELPNRVGDPIFTDTIMLLSLNIESGQLSGISIPRDLWSPEYQTKVNALYFYGQERYPETPQQFTTEVISELTNVPIHHTVVLSLDKVAELIDLIDGVEVNIEEGFVDEQFPRSDVDIRTERDPTKLYQRVEFVTGNELMTGERALQYIRSRKSANLNQGTDEARGHRQQQIIAALLVKLSDAETLTNARLMGSLYRWYQQTFGTIIPVPELIATAKSLPTQFQAFQFDAQSLSIQNGDDNGVLVHPPEKKYQQWVYEINNREEFQKEVQQLLNIQ